MRRVVVIGTTGAGKSTFAAKLGVQLNLPFTQLDALYWGSGWTPRDDFMSQIAAVVATDEWIIDGNYSQARNALWRRADTIIWLDYSLPIVLQRLLSRTARRWLSGKTLWAGNRERLRVHLFSRQSIFRWCVTSFYRHRREYPDLLLKAARRGTYIVRFRSPRAAKRWLADLRAVDQTLAATPLDSGPSG